MQRSPLRPFLVTGLVFGASIGFTLGATLVLGLVTNTWTRSWLPHAQAHGHAQLWGWLLFLSAGVLYQVLPRDRGIALPIGRLAGWTYGILVVGVVLRIIGQPLANQPTFAVLAIVGSGLEVVGVTVLVVGMEWIRRQSLRVPGPLDLFLPPALVWLWVATAGESVAGVLAARAGVLLVSSPWHDAALTAMLWGYAVLLIGGVSLRSFEHMFGLPTPDLVRGRQAWLVLNGGIALTVVSPLLALTSLADLNPLVGAVGAVLLLVGGLLLAHSQGLCPLGQFRTRFAPGEGSVAGFIRAGYLWLVVAGLAAVVDAGFWLAGSPPGYFALNGARHALTLGFIAMVVFGMASRILPMFTGLSWYSERLHWWTFGLLNLATVIRTIVQPSLGYTEGGALLGLGAILALTAFGLFAYNCVMTLLGHGRRIVTATAIGPATMTAEVLDAIPGAAAVLVRHGVKAAGSAEFRERRARVVTIGHLAQDYGIDLDRLVDDLRQSAEDSRGSCSPALTPVPPPSH